MEWTKVTDGLPELKDKKAYPVLAINEKKTRKVVYYFPERFKTIEWEDWDDYNEADYPYTENDEKAGCVWLRPGFYFMESCERCETYYEPPFKATHWMPLPPPPTN